MKPFITLQDGSSIRIDTITAVRVLDASDPKSIVVQFPPRVAVDFGTGNVRILECGSATDAVELAASIMAEIGRLSAGAQAKKMEPTIAEIVRMSTASGFCQNINLDPAVAFVSAGHGTFIDLAQRAFNQASSQANSLGNSLINPVSFNVSFDFSDQLTPFSRPERPVFDLTKLEFNAPEAVTEPPQFGEQPVELLPVPQDAPLAPIMAFPDRPNAPSIQPPTPPPAPATLVIPTAPDMTLPAVPTMLSLNIPQVPNVVIPLFEGERPQFVEPPLNENWHFEPTAYIGALEAGKFMQETAIAIFNARVGVFQAKLGAYQTNAQVLTARIQAAERLLGNRKDMPRRFNEWLLERPPEDRVEAIRKATFGVCTDCGSDDGIGCMCMRDD